MDQPAEVEKIIDKIKKLLALSKSDNPHEAALAAERASALLLKHNLDIREVEQTNTEKQTYIQQEFAPGGKQIEQAWRRQLANVIARNNFCHCVTLTYGRRYSPRASRKTVAFIGKPENIEVARYLYEYLAYKIAGLADEKWLREGKFDNSGVDRYGYRTYAPINTAAWKRAFAEGAILEISNRLYAARKAAQTADANTMALVLVTDNELKTAVSTFFPKLGTTRERFSPSDAAYESGRQAGRNIPINHAVNGARQAPKGLLR